MSFALSDQFRHREEDGKPFMQLPGLDLGWAFQYAIVDDNGSHNAAELRKVQDWFPRFQLRSIPGVSKVASVGGFEQQYQVQVDPDKLRAFGIGIREVVEAVRSGTEAAGRVLELAGSAYMIRGREYLRSISDLEEITLSLPERTSLVRVKDVGRVTLGPEMRRGTADLDGKGVAVTGIVILRPGISTENVIQRVKRKLEEVKTSLPHGIRVVPIYDRSIVIEQSIRTMWTTLIEVVLTVVIVICLFLWHVPSSLIPAVTIPATVLIACLTLHAFGITSNIMSIESQSGPPRLSMLLSLLLSKAISGWRNGNFRDRKPIVRLWCLQP